MIEPILKVNNLTVILDNKTILSNLSFEIKPQKVLAIIGPNGSGKSVLLKTLVGIIKPTSGEINWQKDTKIGYLPQRFHVDYYLPFTVEEFLKLKQNPKYSPAEIIEIIGLNKNWLNRKLAHLSSGELQKILLAWAILDKPSLLLFDEPTENVDVVGQKSIYTLLRHLQDELKLAIIIVSHDLHVVYRYTDQVLCLNQKMLCYGEPHLVLTTEKLAETYGDHTFFHHHHYNE